MCTDSTQYAPHALIVLVCFREGNANDASEPGLPFPSERPFSRTLHGAPLKNKLPALNFMKRLLLIHVDDVLHFEGKLV